MLALPSLAQAEARVRAGRRNGQGRSLIPVKFRKVVIKRLSNLDYAWIAALYSLQLFSLKIVLKNHDNAVILLGAIGSHYMLRY